jgi:hypothetical protein
MNKVMFGLGVLALGSMILLGARSNAQNALVNFDLKMNVKVGDAPLELGKSYKTPGGADFTVDLLKIYVSNVQLVQADGSSLSIPGVALASWSAESEVKNAKLMDGGQMHKAVSSSGATFFKLRAPAGEYKGVRFEVGVPKDLNHRDASTMALPLGLESGMFWAWNPGYIFFRIEGKTVVAGKAQPWLLHMGTDNWRMNVNLFDLTTNKVKVRVAEGGGYTVNLNVMKLFEKGPNGASTWNLADAAQRVMHGGPNVGQAYQNLLGAWSGQ